MSLVSAVAVAACPPSIVSQLTREPGQVRAPETW